MAAEQIVSDSDLFKGELVDKPMDAIVVGRDAEDDEIYACPACGEMQTFMEMQSVGAEMGAGFCWKCNQEFYCD